LKVKSVPLVIDKYVKTCCLRWRTTKHAQPGS